MRDGENKIRADKAAARRPNRRASVVRGASRASGVDLFVRPYREARRLRGRVTEHGVASGIVVVVVVAMIHGVTRVGSWVDLLVFAGWFVYMCLYASGRLVWTHSADDADDA